MNMNMHDPNLGARIQAEGMRINSQAHARGRHGRVASIKSRLVVLAIMIAALVAFVLWLSSATSAS